MNRTCRLLVLALLLLLPAVGYADYKDGWTIKNFYEAVNFCRSSLIYPTARDYEAAGLKHGQTKYALRNEVIANTPLFETIASETCYCALNQYAKDYVFSEFKVRKMEFREYMTTPDCKAKTTNAVEQIKANPKAHTLP